MLGLREVCTGDLTQVGAMSSDGRGRNERPEIWGWILFVVSALFFISASIRSGDALGLLGGIFFLLACLVFLAGYIGPKRR